MNSEIKSIAEKRSLIQTLGSGGVGKTTLSVVLGIAAARRGRKTLVSTIDPSKRLMDTLHIKPDQDVIFVKELGIFAMMIDAGKSWEMILKKYSSEKIYKKILNNRFNNYLRDYFPGFDEYIASEMIYYMMNVYDYDTIIVDSPPSTYAVSYLEASHRILDVLSNDFILSLIPYINAGSIPVKFIMKKEIFILNNIARFTGMEMLTELIKFINDLSPLLQGFRQRADFVRRLYASRKCGFFIVTLPNDISFQNAGLLIRYLDQLKYRLDGIFINRLCSSCGGEGRCNMQDIPYGEIEREIYSVADNRTREIILKYFLVHIKGRQNVFRKIEDFIGINKGIANVFAIPEMRGYIKSLNDISLLYNGIRTLC